MFKVNQDYLKLPGSYLFSTVARKQREYQAAHPEAEIIKLSIGDVTQPLAPAIVEALHGAVDEMAHAETFHGYAPDLGYEFLRSAMAKNDYQAKGCDINADEIFISDGAKEDCGNIQEIFSKDSKIAVCDPVYPVYVDTNVMAGRTGTYDALVKGEGVEAASALEGIQASYDNEKTDEFVEPFVVMKDGAPTATVKDGDSMIFFNFRPDRAREITRTFCDDQFDGFERGERVKTTYVCFTEYDVTIENKLVAFVKEEITNTFGEFLAAKGLKQARIAETEKYAHVTFFFNGGVEEPNEGEDRILVKSPKVATYDLKPEMSAYEVSDKLVDAIKSDKYDVIIINYANPDMVGHTGVEPAAIKAIEAVDECVGRAVEAVKEVNGQMFISADHGNAEQLIDEETGEPFTAHTTNPVPFILVNADPSYKLREGGCLADIAPTLIELMGMEQPKEMTGKSLLLK